MCSLPTPRPVLDAKSCFDDELVHYLNELLCITAQQLVRGRTPTGRGWSPITGELITVVCREVPAEITATETQYWWGWRYSKHLTAAFDSDGFALADISVSDAFDSDVYVVTPHGWAAMLGDWRGPTPALPSGDVLMDCVPVVQEAERLLTDASDVLLTPEPRECLLCYVSRMVDAFGCDCSLRFATRYRDLRAPRATSLERRLGQVGGFCDCEIFLNGYGMLPRYWLPGAVANNGDATDASSPDPLPQCLGVRRGSTQPCGLWHRSRRC